MATSSLQSQVFPTSTHPSDIMYEPGLNSDDDEITILDENSRYISQPKDIKPTLKSHQKALINYCDYLEHNTSTPITVSDTYKYNVFLRLGIIGDHVGSGKTLSILGLISHTKTRLPEYNFSKLSITNPLSLHNLGYIEQISLEETRKVFDTSIIIVSHTLFKQWVLTIERDTSLKFIFINSIKTLNQFVDIAISKHIEDFDGILISSTFIKRFNNKLYLLYYGNNGVGEDSISFTVCFKRVIYDEADTIKISSVACDHLEPMFTWMVSSSYQNLLYPDGIMKWKNINTNQFSVHYSYSQGYTHRENILKGVDTGKIRNQIFLFNKIPSCITKLFVVKNDREFVKSAFNLIEPKLTVIKCKTPYALQILSGSISQDLLNYINAGDIDTAIDTLQFNKVSEDNLVMLVTAELTSKLENLNIEFNMKNTMNWKTDADKKSALDNITYKIRNIESKIENITNKIETSDCCNICFEECTRPSVVPCCNSTFCFVCISKWITSHTTHVVNSCPFCRSNFNIDELIVIDNKCTHPTKTQKQSHKKTKMEMLEDIITTQMSKRHDSKFLIFSDYSGSFKNMTDILDRLTVQYGIITGTSSSIHNKIQKYKGTDNSSLNCLLLNAQYSACGINLENTTDIIIGHRMTSEKTEQIIGRGQRPGRIGQLNVWHLRYENEM